MQRGSSWQETGAMLPVWQNPLVSLVTATTLSLSIPGPVPPSCLHLCLSEVSPVSGWYQIPDSRNPWTCGYLLISCPVPPGSRPSQ